MAEVNIKKVMRLNNMVTCSFCQVKVNPYVIQKKPNRDRMTVECPNCENTWDVKWERVSGLPWEHGYIEQT